jgi:hypothetical protein
MNENKTIGTLADVLSLIDQTGLTGTRRRDMISAIKRICEMAGTTPACVCAGLPVLKEMLSRIRPAAHGVSAKSYSNLRSLLAAALQLAGVIDPSGRGRAIRCPGWGPLLEAVADDQRLSNGLAAFANWCAGQSILPGEVDDSVVQQFLTWPEAKTLHPKPRDLVRRIPNVWNEASTKFNSWPTGKLTTLSFKAPSRHLNCHHPRLDGSRDNHSRLIAKLGNHLERLECLLEAVEENHWLEVARLPVVERPQRV